MRRIVRPKKPAAAAAAAEEATAPRPLTPKQRTVVEKLRRGWRIMYGLTARSISVSGYESFSWGEMLCPPGQDSGQRITGRMIDALSGRGVLEEVTRGPIDISSLEALIRTQSEPRECYRLTSVWRKHDP